MKKDFSIGVTRDFLKPNGTSDFDTIGAPAFEDAGLHWEYLPTLTSTLTAAQVQNYDALLVLGAGVTTETVAGADRLAIIARFGVGYDKVDVAACTENGVLLTIAPDGVRRPVATSILTFVLALSHQLLIKDRLTRGDGWAHKQDYMGMGLVGRTLGLVGMGNIGAEVFRLAQPFGMQHIAFDPYVSTDDAEALNVELVGLDTLMQTADFVCVCCPLTAQTRGLINAHRIELMKPTAYLINTARGPIVDQGALTDALRHRRIQGAGLDVFEEEPIAAADPLLELDNVIVTPHSICWTDECFQRISQSACDSIARVAIGQLPSWIVNSAVVDNPKLHEKLNRLLQEARLQTAPTR